MPPGLSLSEGCTFPTAIHLNAPWSLGAPGQQTDVWLAFALLVQIRITLPRTEYFQLTLIPGSLLACPPAASALAPTTTAPATSQSPAVARPRNTLPSLPRSELCAVSPPLPCSEAPTSSCCQSGTRLATSNRSQTVAGVSALQADHVG